MNDLYSNKNLFELELSFRVSIAGNYDYIIDYMENVAPIMIPTLNVSLLERELRRNTVLK